MIGKKRTYQADLGVSVNSEKKELFDKMVFCFWLNVRKDCYSDLEKVCGWIHKIFEITRKICFNIESSKQFWNKILFEAEYFLNLLLETDEVKMIVPN